MASPAIDMRPYMGADLAALYVYDFPDIIIYQGKNYSALIRDRVLEELDEFGGPILINILEIHVLTSALSSIPNGVLLTAKGGEKEVKTSMLSEDGNELIINVRAA